MNPPRRKKHRSSDPPHKIEVDPLRPRTPPPGFKNFEEWALVKLEEAKKRFLEASKNFDTKRDEKFWEDWRISDGFDVDSPPLGKYGTPRVIKDVNSSHNRYLCDSAYDCARLAIKYENDHKNSNLELLELVKFNLCGHVYYLTFKAKDREDGSVDVYQSQVFIPPEVVRKDHKDRERKTEVRMFRKKPSEYQQSQGVEEKRKTKEGCGSSSSCCDGCSSVEKRKTKEGCATVHSQVLRRSARQRQKKDVDAAAAMVVPVDVSSS